MENDLVITSSDYPLISVITSDYPIAKCKPSVSHYKAGTLSKGSYQVYPVDSMKSFYEKIIKPLNRNNSLTLGVPANGSLNGKIVSSKNKQEGAITRTKNDIVWNPKGLSFILIDIDGGDVPGMDLNSTNEVRSLLVTYDPILLDTSMIILPSASQKYDLSDKSWHVYIACSNADEASIQSYKNALQSVAWNKGHGHIKIDKAGSRLVRQIFDMAVFSPERLSLESVFSFDTSIVFHEIDPLIQEGKYRDLSIPLQTDLVRSKSLIEEAKKRALSESLKIRKESKEVYVNKRSAVVGKDQAYREAIKMFDEQTLPPEAIIVLHEAIDGKREFSASEIKINTDKFEDSYCCDPYYPEEGTQKAIINSDGNIYTFKHGGYVIKTMVSMTHILEKVETIDLPAAHDGKRKVLSQIKQWCSFVDITKEDISDLQKLLKKRGFIDALDGFRVKGYSFYEVGQNGKLLGTDLNMQRLLEKHSFQTKYDIIKKELTIEYPELNSKIDNIIDTSASIIKSCAEREGLPKDMVDTHLSAVACNKNAFNPLAQMIEDAMREYDGKDYLQEIIDCLIVDASAEYKYEIFKRWSIEGIATWYHDEDTLTNPEAKLKFENILVFLGAQGLNKTKFLFELLNFEGYGSYFKEGVKIDTSDKDSIKTAVSAGLVELGELDATFKKSDVADLKAFLSKQNDEIRLPYDKNFSKYKRRTLFAATVNERYFLIDKTGNRRYWIFDLLDIDFKRLDKINMKQFWGQMGKLYFEGHKWWFDPKDEHDQPFVKEIEAIQRRHLQTSSIDDLVIEFCESIKEKTTINKIQVSPTRILNFLGIQNPSKTQINEFKTAFEKISGITPNKSSQYSLPRNWIEPALGVAPVQEPFYHC